MTQLRQAPARGANRKDLLIRIRCDTLFLQGTCYPIGESGHGNFLIWYQIRVNFWLT